MHLEKLLEIWFYVHIHIHDKENQSTVLGKKIFEFLPRKLISVDRDSHNIYAGDV